jgi:hypothetical protein
MTHMQLRHHCPPQPQEVGTWSSKKAPSPQHYEVEFSNMWTIRTGATGPSIALASPQQLQDPNRKRTKGFIPLKLFPRCGICLDLCPGRQAISEQESVYIGKKQSQTFLVKDVRKSSQDGCAGCAVLDAVLTPYNEAVYANSYLRLYQSSYGRALRLELDDGLAVNLEMFTTSSWRTFGFRIEKNSANLNRSQVSMVYYRSLFAHFRRYRISEGCRSSLKLAGAVFESTRRLQQTP